MLETILNMSEEEDIDYNFDSSVENPGERIALIQAELAAKEKEAIDAIKEDICNWLSRTLELTITGPSFLDSLDTGVVLCKLATLIQEAVRTLETKGEVVTVKIPMEPLSCNTKAKKRTFFARDNASNFIEWVRGVGVPEAVLFESSGLVDHGDEKRVVLCLLDVGRVAGRLGLSPPELVRMEREIEELEKEEEMASVQPPSLSPERPVSERDHVTEVPSPVRTASLRPLADTPPPPRPPTRIPVPTHPSGRPRGASLAKTPPPSRSGNVSSPSDKLTPPGSTQTTPPPRVRYGKRGRESEDDEPTQRQQKKRQRTEKKETKKDTKKDVEETKNATEEEETKKETVDEKVMRRVNECTCSNKFEVSSCGRGKFIVKGASGRKMTVYARLLSDRVMVRVGGGWDSLDHFLLKHDPCRIHKLTLAGRTTKKVTVATVRAVSPQDFMRAAQQEQ